jgi:hypothetical protein
MGGFLPTFGALDPPLSAWVYDRLLGSHGDRGHGRDPTMAASSLFESVLWSPADTVSGAVDLPEVLTDHAVGYVAERFREAPASGFSLNCGEYIGGIHDQADNGSVTLSAGNVPLLIDSSTANNPVEGSPSSSRGHNVVLSDGRGQLPSGGGWGCSGAILDIERSRETTVLTADIAASYAARGYNPVEHAVRHCVFAKHPFTYMLLVDDFSRPGGQEATFEQLFHTPPATAHQLVADGIEIKIEFGGETCGLVLRAVDEGAQIGEADAFVQHDRTLFDGHPVWQIRGEGTHVVMPTLILPFAGERPPDVVGDFSADAGTVTLRWSVEGQEGIDVLAFAPGRTQPAMVTRSSGCPNDGSRPAAASQSLLTGAVCSL